MKKITSKATNAPHVPFHIIRRIKDINRYPFSGNGILHIGQARRKPVATVCALFDYGIDASLIDVWNEWTDIAITSDQENEYREGSSRARLNRFSTHLRQLIAAWLWVYTRITPEVLRPPLELPQRSTTESHNPEVVLATFRRLYHREESLKELWTVLDAVAASSITRPVVRMNLLSYFEAIACIVEATCALRPIKQRA